MGFLPDLTRRSTDSELLDAPDLGRKELGVALAHVADANFYFGGVRSLRRHLGPHAARLGELTLLDVGVGNGTVSGRVAEDFRARSVRVRWVGVDLALTALAVAAGERGSAPGRLGLVAADARSLPFGDESFDVSTATLTLHHFRDEECLAVLAEMGRVSRLAVIVSDLERSAMNWLGARLVSETLWRSDRLARNDAALSVRRSFTADELRSLAERVGFRQIEVRRHFPFRIVLEARP